MRGTRERETIGERGERWRCGEAEEGRNGEVLWQLKMRQQASSHQVYRQHSQKQ